MNENTTADTSVNATAIDDETLSRAVLTYCLDSADAMMYALVKGIGSATHTLQLLADSGPGNHESVATAAYKTLDAALINGITVGDAPSMLEVWPPSTAQWSRGSIA